MKFSPLFWPVQLRGSTVSILDETQLPKQLRYLKITSYQQACKAIKEMKTRAVGQVILVFYAFLLALRTHKDTKATGLLLKKVASSLNASRPTLPFKVLTEMVLEWHRNGVPLEQAIDGFLAKLKMGRIRQAEAAARLLADGDTVLTHCNVSGLMPLIAGYAEKSGKRVRFFVTETRPYLQGSRLTAWELKRGGFDVTIIGDSMVAQVMSEKKIRKVIVGADHLAQNGDFANKIGTYQIALLAHHFGIPFYVLAPPASRAATGRDIAVEVRPGKELLEFNGCCIGPRGAKAYYPAFDVTPARLVSKHIPLEFAT